MTNTTELLDQTKDALAQAERERALVREQHRQEIAAFDQEISRLRGAIRALEGRKPSRKRTAAVQAGPAALSKVRTALATGPLTQAQITKQTKLNDGTVSYALRALVENGEVEATGVRHEGSREFRLVAQAKVA